MSWSNSILFALAVVFSTAAKGQSFRFNLSPRHQSKLDAVQSGHKRMVKYYKFAKRDSARHVRNLSQRAKREKDSLVRAAAQTMEINHELKKRGITGDKQIFFADSLHQLFQAYTSILNDSAATDSARQVAKEGINGLTKDKLNKSLAIHGHPHKVQFQQLQNAKAELKKWWTLMRDTTATDSTRKVAREKVKELALMQAMHNPQFQGMYAQYQQYGQKPDWNALSKHVPELDTLQAVFDSTSEQLFAKAEGMATQALTEKGNLGDFSKQAAEFDQYKKQLSQLSNLENIRAEGKEQLKEQVVDHFAGQEDKLQGVQKKLTRLLGKYQSFTNSSDLSTAVKRTSLEGKTFKERIVLGGNFNVQSTDPVSIDFAPLVSYRLNTKFYLGIGMNYRLTFGDSLKHNWHVSPTNTSFRVLASYDLVKNFFSYGEVERAGLKGNLSDEQKKQWRNNYFVGVGKRFLVHPKFFMTVTALYNLNNEDNNPTYPRRFQIRFGFETSDLAFTRPKYHYRR
ncbi:MAG: hypothetical protein JNL17_07235 [Cyclobacteriaceae bacterium]|nr:hypothetical protein [Cyclobacteriaceae bacterium]